MSGRNALVAEPLVSSTFDALASSRWVLVTTYTANGDPVATPVSPAVVDGRLYFAIDARSGAGERLARDPRVAVARSTSRGRPTGPSYAGTARVLAGADAAALRPFLRRPGFLGRLLAPADDGACVVEVAPVKARR